MTVQLSDISFLQKGTGKDLVFLHGYLSSKEAFAAQIAYFSKFYRVTALDFLGFGKSKPLEKPFSVGDYAEWTKSALRLLDVENPNVIAHSFGCRVAVKMAAIYENAFDKIVLTGPAGVIMNRGFRYKCKQTMDSHFRNGNPRTRLYQHQQQPNSHRCFGCKFIG